MERIYKNISLDIYDDITSQLSLSVKQGDTTRGIRVSLTDHGKVFNIPDSCYAVFSARKSNGVFISDGCTIQNNTIVYDFSDAVVSVASQLDCELTVYSASGKKITSPSFMIFVYKTIEEEYAGEVVESNSFTVLNNLISNATATINEANEAAENANASADEAVEKTDNAIAEAVEKTDNAIAEAVEKTDNAIAEAVEKTDNAIAEAVAKTDTATEEANKATEEANKATEEARASVVNIKKTSDGKLQLLDADLNVIDTIDVCYMDNDTIYRYNNGVLSVVGIKELNADKTFRMWVGTREEWDDLTEKDEHTFYWVTNDTTYDILINSVNALNKSQDALVSDLKSGEFKVHSAEALTAANLLRNNFNLSFNVRQTGLIEGLNAGKTYAIQIHVENQILSFIIKYNDELSRSNTCIFKNTDNEYLLMYIETGLVSNDKSIWFKAVNFSGENLLNYSCTATMYCKEIF